MVERDVLINENIRIVEERALVTVLEVMAVFVGGGEGLAAARVGAVDQSKGGFFVLEEDEGAGELGVHGDGQAEDAAAVELRESENIADGLVTEPETAAFLLGQALGRDVGVERGKLETAGGAGGGCEALEPQIVVAVFFEALEDGAAGIVKPFGHSRGCGGGGPCGLCTPCKPCDPSVAFAPEEQAERGFFLLKEVADVLFEERGDFVQGSERRSPFVGLEEGDEFRGEPQGAGEGPLGEAQLCAGFFDPDSKNPLHACLTPLQGTI